MPRFYCPAPLAAGTSLPLPAGTARHVQVLRMQPGHALTLFNGEGGEWDATVTTMGRSDVVVQVQAHHAAERETLRAMHLAIGMPANDRMDWLAEKATELGAASLQPLLAQRSVLRLSDDRAAKKQAHWQGIAVAACEQCGRNRVPPVHAVQDLASWRAPADALCLVLSLRGDAVSLHRALQGVPQDRPLVLLSGPEGGLSGAEEDAARAQGFAGVTLGPRVLRAETAPLAVLAAIALADG